MLMTWKSKADKPFLVELPRCFLQQIQYAVGCFRSDRHNGQNINNTFLSSCCSHMNLKVS